MCHAMFIKQNKGDNTAIYMFPSSFPDYTLAQKNSKTVFLVWQQGGLGELFCTQRGNV